MENDGGSDKNKNVFANYPEPIKSFMDLFRPNVNRGVKKDTQKMYEQEICSKMENVGQLVNEKNPDGSNLCGWCYMGRKGDGTGEGMVLHPEKPNTPKYDDDYCPWPREIKKEYGKYVKTKFYNTIDKRELKMWNIYKKLLAAGFSYEYAVKLSRKTKGTDRGINKLESIIKDNPKVDMEKYSKTNITKRSKLLVNQSEAQALDQLFPCFTNFTGKKKNDVGKYIGHTDECYSDMWSYMTPKCNGEVMFRIPNSGLPGETTFNSWDKVIFLPLRRLFSIFK